MCSTEDGAHIFITNLQDGLDHYKLPTMEKIQSFEHSISQNVPLKVAVNSRGNLIVCGGDDGRARVYERHSGKLLTRLTHSERE